MRAKRLAIWIASALVLAALVAYALRPTPIPVELAEVRRGALQITVDEEGKTRVRDRFVVSAPVAGELQRISLEAGDRVEAGEAVGALLPAASTPLDPRTRAELEQRLQAAEASIRAATASSEFAAAELSRQRQLARRGAVAQRSLEAAELQAEASTRQMEEARALAQALRAQLGRGGGKRGATIELRAPVAGTILRVLQESEAVVAPGTPVLEIGSAADLEVVTDVLSEEAVGVLPGAAVILDRWGGDAPLRGRVRLVEPSAYTKISALGVEEQRVDVIIDLLDPPEARRGLGDGYRVVSRIVTFSTDDALIVPLGALFRTGDGWSVFVVEEGVARMRTVQIGKRGEELVQIAAGLEPAESVVLYPGDRLEDGSPVTNHMTPP